MRKRDILRLKNNPIIHAVYLSAKECNADIYLVGGVIRNIMCSFPIGCDYDFALTGRVKDVAERFAISMNGSPFLLDKEIDSFRIVVKKGAININVDLSPLKGRNIIEDIFARDFTVNAMAIDLRELFEKDKVLLIDPLNGAKDSKKRLIAPVKEGIFDDDPVRLLRAVRLSAQYGFSINMDAENLIKAEAHLLKTSSWERIRDEFFATIICHNAGDNLKKLYAFGLLQEIFPEIIDWERLEDYDLMSHIIKAVQEGERIVCGITEFIPEYEEVIFRHFNGLIGNIPRSAFFKFVIFLHDAGKAVAIKIDGERLRFPGHEIEGEAIAKKTAKRLKLSRKASGVLCKLIRNHHRVFNMASMEKVSSRSKAHFFRIMEQDGIDLLFMSLADARATRGGEDLELAELVKEVVSFYFDVYAVKKPPPLLKGNDVMRIFKIPEGIMVGKILKEIQDAEAMGLIKNKRDAVEFIKNGFFYKPKGN